MDHVPAASEHHYQACSFAFEGEALSPAAQRVISLNPEFVLGSYTLFDYDPIRNVICLSSSFRTLLELCVNLNILDPQVLEAKSIDDLNAVFQKTQGSQGGFLRKEGSERWDLKDSEAMEANKDHFDALFQSLGFNQESLLKTAIGVDHCVVFGAAIARLETRLIKTFKNLQNNLRVTGHVFLLGSNRKLTESEKTELLRKIESLPEERKAYWTETFQKEEFATEANAFSFLWELLVPPDLKDTVNVISIASTRTGSSYHGTAGHRPTTEITIEDWMRYYDPEKPQSIFAFTEQPYNRLYDQFLNTVLSNKRAASLKELEKRARNTAFHFVTANPGKPPLQAVIFDEIARHVYRIKGTLEYLKGLEVTGE